MVSAPQLRAPRGRVLIVDDEPYVAASIARVLRRAGFEVVTASGGEQARQCLATGPFHVVFADINMPGLSGIDVLRMARTIDLDLPVVLMTADPQVETAVQALHTGAFDYLCKPVDKEGLLSVAEKAKRLCTFARAQREAHTSLGTPPQAIDLAGLEAGFDRALASLWMAFQPIVRVSDHSVFGYEALMRTREPSLPHPGAVLDAADRLGRLPELSRAVRDRTTQVLAASPGVVAFMNLHPRDLSDTSLLGAGALLDGMADRVVLEITERASLSNISQISSRVASLRAQGYRMAIDDLGAGYASLVSFVQLEPELVKIDMGLVRDVHDNPIKQRLIRAIVDMFHEMDILVVGEGVEVEITYSAIGC